MSNSNPTQQAIENHFASLEKLTDAFMEDFYEAYDQALVSNIDNVDAALSQAKSNAASKLKSFQEELKAANKNLRKTLEEASLEADDQALQDIEDQLKDL